MTMIHNFVQGEAEDHYYFFNFSNGIVYDIAVIDTGIGIFVQCTSQSSLVIL